MPLGEMVRTGLAVFVGAALLSTLAVVVAACGLVEAIAGIRWVLAAAGGGAAPPAALQGRALLEVSVGSGLVLATVACVAFLADLRRQHWL